MIDIDDIRSRYQLLEVFLGERGRRLFAANEALAQGYGGVSATARATGLARSTINRGIAELRAGGNAIGSIDEDYSRLTIPALHIAGWYDIFLSGSVKNFLGMRSAGAGSDAARAGQKLVVGPWTHMPWAPASADE